MLKHITIIKKENFSRGFTGWRIFDPEGMPITAFDRFSEHLITRQYAFLTRQRYSRSAAKFIDYLYEVDVMGNPSSNAAINRAVDAYPIFLSCGTSYDDVEPEKAKALRRYAEEIKLKNGLSRNSFAPTLAAVNLLLVIAQDLADEALHKAQESGAIVPEHNPLLLIKAISGMKTISPFEKKRLQQNSLLGSVMRMRGEMQRPRRLPPPAGAHGQIDLQRLDFPFDRIEDLINAATNYRDKTFYSLLGGSGLRLHEGLNMGLTDIDIKNRTVYVYDPQQKRAGVNTTRDEKTRFKGRAYSRTFLIEPFKSMFFENLEKYIERERVATSEHNYLFQIIERKRRGQPLKDASYTALEKSFKKTVVRAKVPGPDICPDHIWTPHSLRHAYGVYLLNHIPHAEGKGLSLEEVQMLMGHKHIDSTRHYARTDRLILEAKLAEADEQVTEIQAGEMLSSLFLKLGTADEE